MANFTPLSALAGGVLIGLAVAGFVWHAFVPVDSEPRAWPWLVTAIAFRPLLRKRPIDFKTSIDAPLVIGAALFGIGWGIGGYCPGPALTALSNLSADVLVFVAAMVGGGFLAKIAVPAGPGA